MKSLGIKIVVIISICMMFCMGLLFINGIVTERKNYHEQVINDIKISHVHDQFVMTPFLLYQSDKGEQLIFATRSEQDSLAKVSDDKYHRNIYHAIDYQLNLNIKQSFELDKIKTAPLITNANATTNKANTTPSLKLVIFVSDLRGLQDVQAHAYGKKLTTTLTKNSRLPFGHIEADLSQHLDSLGKIDVDIKLDVHGIESLNMIALGDNIKTSLRADWHSPKFIGSALPQQKTIDNQGFDAYWQQNLGNIDNQNLLNLCLKDVDVCADGRQFMTQLSSFGTSFITDNDVYTKTDRSIKYALLLALVSFGVFFLFEVIKKIRIHPIQYGLVGCGLLVFYVLLLSLAEHVSFGVAYLIATLACSVLNGWYARYVLKSVSVAVSFSVLLLGFYGGFYLLLGMHSLNLVLGSVLCFGLIGTVMYITRHIDWYALHDSDDSTKPDTLAPHSPSLGDDS